MRADSGEATQEPARTRDVCHSNANLHQHPAVRSLSPTETCRSAEVLLQPALLRVGLPAAPIVMARGVTRCADDWARASQGYRTQVSRAV
jgi:hypothetical protein